MHDEFGEGKVLGINGKKLQVKFTSSKEIVSVFSDFIKKNNLYKIRIILSKKDFLKKKLRIYLRIYLIKFRKKN